MKLLILGNGFNLDLGLKTRYCDFAKSPQWEKLYASFKGTNKKNLARFLKKKANEGNWFSIEESLAEYAREKIRERKFEHVTDDKRFFEELKDQLDTYLTLESTRIHEKNNVAQQLLDRMNEKKVFDKIYTFNYIPHDALHGWCGCEYERDVVYVHQRLTYGIVLGVAERDITDDKYSFLRKVNQKSYISTNLGNDLVEAEEVVFFGHSLNTIDFDYFRDFFKACSQYNESNNAQRHITIITKDEQSIHSIKNNLESNGISLTSLCLYSNLTFIALDDYYRKDDIERTNMKELMTRLGCPA
jgi:hypothetical protein